MSFFIRVILEFIPVGLGIFIDDILGYTNLVVEGLVYSESQEVIIARIEILSFLTSFFMTSLITALNSLLTTNIAIAIIWFLCSILTALSLKPLIGATESISRLYRAKEFILKKKPLLVVFTFIAVVVTEGTIFVLAFMRG